MKQNANKIVRGMAQMVEHLPRMHKALGSFPSTEKKKSIPLINV
jgi:hypothetical protein